MYVKHHPPPADELEIILGVKHGYLRVPIWRPLVADILQQATVEALKPIVFKRVLKRHVSQVLERMVRCPSLTDQQRLVDGLSSALVFLNRQELSWGAFGEMGHSLSFPGRTSPDLLVSLGQLMGAGQAINEILGYKKTPVRRFCSMCWRFVLSGKKHCRAHQVPIGGASEKLSHGPDNYWFCRKLLPQFTEHVRRLSNQARKEKLRSWWKEAIEDAQVIPWLERHRPLTWQLVVRRVGRLEDAAVLPALIQALDDHDLEVGVLREQRSAFHRSLLDDRKAVFDLLLRAEAWLRAAAERRGNWGGSRVGAGRPARF
ncbi:hypothetical protein [Pseudomonas sp.]|uniref:hypothetical protein n=1 Tax=Pseudomonas sp. TaxID=306 RepID=UPI003A9848AF